MATDFEGGYVSPMLRKAVFDQMHGGGSTITFEIVRIEDAFEKGWRDNGDQQQPPTHAVRCEIIGFDGFWVEAYREIDKREKLKNGWGAVITDTAENMAKFETKAMGRALRNAGIPQKRDELRELMRWLIAVNGNTAAALAEMAKPQQWQGAATADAADSDSPDADDDVKTPSQEVAEWASRLAGPSRAAVAKWAKDEHGVTNILNVGDDEVATKVLEHLRELEESTDGGSAGPD